MGKAALLVSGGESNREAIEWVAALVPLVVGQLSVAALLAWVGAVAGDKWKG